MRQLTLVSAALAISATLFAQTASLRDLAEKRGLRVGTAVSPGPLTNEPIYAETLAREFNQVEPENAAKFGPIHPRQDQYNFDPVDALVSFATDHHMTVRGHTLVWHNQNPAWLTRGTFNAEQLADIQHDHIRTVVGRYAGKIYAWDVVNEAFNDNGTLRKTIWCDTQSTAYIERALRWAHEADPTALLFYNDYAAEGINAKSDAIYAMAKDFKTRGVPLNGIGLQMHLTAKPPTMESMEANIRRITGLGLQVQYTELDVRLSLIDGHATEESLATEAKIYGGLTALCLKYKLCTAIQTWGFTDAHSWIDNQYKGMGAGLEIDEKYQPKPAYKAMQAAMSQK